MKNLKHFVIGAIIAGAVVGFAGRYDVGKLKDKLEVATQNYENMVASNTDLTIEKTHLDQEVNILLGREKKQSDEYNALLENYGLLNSRNRFLQTRYEEELTRVENLRTLVNAYENRLGE